MSGERVVLAMDTRPRVESLRNQVRTGRWTMFHQGERLGAILTGRAYPLRLEQIDTGSPFWRLSGVVEWEPGGTPQ